MEGSAASPLVVRDGREPTYARVNPDDVDVWELLAETEGLAGDTVPVHRARAEYFARVGAFRMSIQHLDHARRLVHDDERRLLARLDQRIIDLRTELEAMQELKD